MKRWILLGIVVVGIVTVIVGNFTWNNKVEKTVQEAKERIDSPMHKDSLGVSDDKDQASAETNETNNGSSETKGIDKETEKEMDETEESNTESPEEESKPTLEEIKSEYYAMFSELEAQETSKVDQLIVEAKADYVSNKAPLSQLIAKYQEVATLLEQNADKTFNVLYQQLEYDLERYGYSKNEAVEFRTSYNTKKNARSSRILSQIQSF